MKRIVIVASLLTACGSSAPVGDAATLGHSTYLVPSGWSSKDYSTHRRPMFEWRPAEDNEHGEAIDVFRVERPALAKNGAGNLERLLGDVVHTLPGGQFSAVQRFVSYGPTGVHVEGTFTPPGATSAYRRFHAVIVDGTSLIHVVYTAREADRDNFDLVVNSLRANREG